MRSARSQLVSTAIAGYYHCVSRCVRRAFLCGNDQATGRSFAHRKQWIENRLHELADIFSAGIYAYAVMSNHVHVVIHVDPSVASAWSDAEIAERWVRLFPVRLQGHVDDAACRDRIAAIVADSRLTAIYRERLCSLSWFMRCLNEPVARMANREDACTGRFWEGRFKCQLLLDERAVIACMSYVDLNPVRAGAATGIRSSAHVSIRRRLLNGEDAAALLRPVAGISCSGLSMANREYVELVEWTGRRLHGGKCARISAPQPSCIQRALVDECNWLAQVSSIETGYWRAIGCIDALVEKAREIGQRWLKGCGRRSVLGRWVQT